MRISPPQVPKSGEPVKLLVTPVLDVAHKHQFTKEETTSIENKTLAGPTYTVGVEKEHKFNMMDSSQKPVPVDHGKEIKYPVMETSHDR